MSRTYKIILFVSVLLTSALWWIDDDPPYPNITDTLKEVAITGSMFTAFFFLAISGVFYLFTKRSM